MFADFISKICDKIVKIAGDDFEKKKGLLEAFVSPEIIERFFAV